MMKLVLKDHRRHILRFDKGEEVFAALTDFLQTNKITAAAFTAIGACSEAELGYYDTQFKGYQKKFFAENLEVVSLVGNCAMAQGKPVIHMHGTFAKTDFSIIGGHAFSLVVSATCEMFLIQLDGTLERKNNPELNLNLLM